MDYLVGVRVISKSNLRSGYHQIHLKGDDIRKTAFRTRCGHCENVMMPFGVANMSDVFREYMNCVAYAFLELVVMVFIHRFD